MSVRMRMHTRPAIDRFDTAWLEGDIDKGFAIKAEKGCQSPLPAVFRVPLHSSDGAAVVTALGCLHKVVAAEKFLLGGAEQEACSTIAATQVKIASVASNASHRLSPRLMLVR